jgi:hypothetical protein
MEKLIILYLNEDFLISKQSKWKNLETLKSVGYSPKWTINTSKTLAIYRIEEPFNVSHLNLKK